MIAIYVALAAAGAALIVYLVMSKKKEKAASLAARELSESRAALAASRAEADARQSEMRESIRQAQQRESEAKQNQADSVRRLDDLGSDFRSLSEANGRLQGEAMRVTEVKDALSERDERIRALIDRVSEIDRERIEARKDAEASKTLSQEVMAKEREAQGEILRAKDEQIAKLEIFISQSRDALSMEFKALSSDMLKSATNELTKAADQLIEKHGEKTAADVQLHQQHIETILKPMEETIKRLDESVAHTNISRTKAETILDEQVKRLAMASESLSNALRKPVVRGSWGEMSLEIALESAGLERGIDYVLQDSTDAEDGRRRTDAVVSLPRGKKLVIDSKNLMDSFLAFTNADSDEQKTIFADAHARSLKNHIKALSSKEYWRRYDSIDCVILFIPHDGMYHAAIRDEADLIRDASEKRVFISNPVTLIPLLKSVRYVLDQEKLNESAQRISEVGAEMYGEISRFAENLAKVGGKLKATVAAYNEAIPGLDRFIVSKSRTLKQLGAAKGPEAELPEPVDIEPRLFSSRELRTANSLLSDSSEQPADPEPNAGS